MSQCLCLCLCLCVGVFVCKYQDGGIYDRINSFFKSFLLLLFTILDKDVNYVQVILSIVCEYCMALCSHSCSAGGPVVVGPIPVATPLTLDIMCSCFFLTRFFHTSQAYSHH